jgi:hypothetical protein
MDAPGWKVARLSEIPGAAELPGFSREEYFEKMRLRAPHILGRWEDAAARAEGKNRKTHAVRGFLGIESVGVNAFEAHAGELLVVPHDELGEGEQQEELYIVVEGRAASSATARRSSSGGARCSSPAPASSGRRPRSRRRRCSSGRRPPRRAVHPPIWAHDWSDPAA